MCLKGFVNEYAYNGRKYRITCIDKDDIPLNIFEKSIGGCISGTQNSIGSAKFPFTLKTSCPRTDEAVKFNFEWLN